MNRPTRSTRVAVADDHPLFLDGLRLLLGTTAGIEVVAAEADGAALLEKLDGVDVDVVVVDLDMPRLDGAGVARELSRSRPELAVLVLTMHEDGPAVLRALEAGARGYLLKGAGHGAIVRAVQAVAEGDTVLGGGVAAGVLAAATAPRRAGGPDGLTDREHEVLALVARGYDNHAIAAQLFLSVKTVQNHVSALLSKTGSSSRAQLVARARDASAPDVEPR